MAAVAWRRLTRNYAIDRSGKPRKILRFQREGFDREVRGARDSNAIPCPSRTPIPASKAELSTLRRTGSFYFALTDVLQRKSAPSPQPFDLARRIESSIPESWRTLWRSVAKAASIGVCFPAKSERSEVCISSRALLKR